MVSKQGNLLCSGQVEVCASEWGARRRQASDTHFLACAYCTCTNKLTERLGLACPLEKGKTAIHLLGCLDVRIGGLGINTGKDPLRASRSVA